MTGGMAAAVKTATIERSDTVSGGRYVLSAGGHEAEMTFSRVNPRPIIVDHTGVPEAMRGTGAGQRLAMNAIEDARQNGWKIMPLCPFMRAQTMRHPEWKDVIQG